MDIDPASRQLIADLLAALEAVMNDEPIDTDAHPLGESDWYGKYECGCSWDSGPYPLHCGRHSPQKKASEVMRRAKELLG